MKKLLILVLIGMFSCKSSKSGIMENNQKEAMLFYSKGPCLGKCPVYDFTIFSDGTLIYNGISKVEKKGQLNGKLTSKQLSDLKAILKENLGEPENFRKIRDIPITTLRFNDKKYEYHSSRNNTTMKFVEAEIQKLIRTVIS